MDVKGEPTFKIYNISAVALYGLFSDNESSKSVRVWMEPEAVVMNDRHVLIGWFNKKNPPVSSATPRADHDNTSVKSPDKPDKSPDKSHKSTKKPEKSTDKLDQAVEPDVMQMVHLTGYTGAYAFIRKQAKPRLQKSMAAQMSWSLGELSRNNRDAIIDTANDLIFNKTGTSNTCQVWIRWLLVALEAQGIVSTAMVTTIIEEGKLKEPQYEVEQGIQELVTILKANNKIIDVEMKKILKNDPPMEMTEKVTTWMRELLIVLEANNLVNGDQHEKLVNRHPLDAFPALVTLLKTTFFKFFTDTEEKTLAALG